jgi:hypothetical protein
MTILLIPNAGPATIHAKLALTPRLAPVVMQQNIVSSTLVLTNVSATYAILIMDQVRCVQPVIPHVCNVSMQTLVHLATVQLKGY